MTTQVQPTSKTVTANGINIHYLDWGTEGKPPMVLLHGLRGHARVWEDVAESLCGDFHVYSVDQRGRGDTDHAPGGDYSTDASWPTLPDSWTPSGSTSSSCSATRWAGATAWRSPANTRSGWKRSASLTSARNRADRRQSYHGRIARSPAPV